MLAPAETRYSATEREALAAKESLVHFQPFIEGERILLVTDHSALTWAKTYENANRRLAAWGLVFAAFPEMVIIHRPGRIHSNVYLTCRIPNFVSPARDDLPDLSLLTEHDELQKVWNEFIKDQELVTESKLVDVEKGKKGNTSTETHLHIYVKGDLIKRFVEGYTVDKEFSKVNFDERKYRVYRVADNGLLYFEDADSRLRLCVPNSERSAIVKAIHDEAHEGTHAGWERTLASAREHFYWPRMSSDMKEYVSSCDPCQKIKHN